MLRLFFLTALFLLSHPLLAQKNNYLWPTEASPYLSSTFGETRAAHFHSGLDIKTWGREGYKVFASKAGIVYRLAISVQGYGRVIYLKHHDGSYTVYAHLQRFNNELQSLVDSVRLAHHTFEIDWVVDSLNIKVEQGDVIGFSGSTGIGPPHLHFEIRNANDEPINPLLTNLSVPDTVAPTISSLLIFPLSDSSTVNGSRFPRIFYPKKRTGNTSTFGVVPVRGPVGFAISNYDGANNVPNKYAVYEAGLLHNRDTLFKAKIDSFSFDHTETMFLDRIAALGGSQRSYQTFFSQDGPGVPFQTQKLHSPYIYPSDSTEVYTLYVKDIYENTSQATITLIKDHNIPEPSKTPPIHLWYWTNDWVSPNNSTSISFDPPPGWAWNRQRHQRWVPLENYEGILSRIYPESSYQIQSTDQRLDVHFNQHTFFDTLSVFTYTGTLDTMPYFAIHPATAPVRKDYFVEFFLGKDFSENKNYRLFWIDRSKNQIKYVPSQLVGRTIHATPDVLGEFIALPDDVPPEISRPKIIKTNYGTWQVMVPVYDELSGIDYNECEILVNGVRGITEYDFEEDLLIYIHPDFIPQKTNRIRVLVKDKAGNTRLKTYQI